MATAIGTLALFTPRPASLGAQEGSVVFEGGAVHALPSADVADVAATYGIGGVRIEWSAPRGGVAGGAYGGRADAGTDFLSALIAGQLWLTPRATVGAGLGGMLQAFAADDPLRYRVRAAELLPLLWIGRGAVQLRARGRLGSGTVTLEARRADGVVRRAERDLWSRGVDVELGWSSARAAVAGVVGAHRSQAGSFRRGGLRLAVEAGSFTVRVDTDRWETPAGWETVGGVSLSVPLGRMEARASAGRTVPDPLTQVESGTQTSALIGLRLVSFGGREPVLVHEILEPGRPACVRIDVAPTGARAVEVLGDFSGWEPVPLARDGTRWTLELSVEPGFHHFGFLVDGEWWIPEGVQGAVPDEWGRVNATMVVPDQEREP